MGGDLDTHMIFLKLAQAKAGGTGSVPKRLTRRVWVVGRDSEKARVFWKSRTMCDLYCGRELRLSDFGTQATSAAAARLLS